MGADSGDRKKSDQKVWHPHHSLTNKNVPMVLKWLLIIGLTYLTRLLLRKTRGCFVFGESNRLQRREIPSKLPA